MRLLALLLLLTALPAAAAPAQVPAAALAAPDVDLGRTTLAGLVGMPVHLATTVGVLAVACTGEVVRVRCDDRLQGTDGARAITYFLLATLPPLASSSVVWGIGDDPAAPGSLTWTFMGGVAAQALGFGLAVATDSPAVGLLSVTAFPVAGELAGLLLTRSPPPGAMPLAAAPLAGPVASAVPLREPPVAAAGERGWVVPLVATPF